MKNFGYLLIVFSSIILLISPVKAQGIKVGIGGGLTSVQSPDGITNEISAGGIGFNSEYHLGIKAKFSIPLIPLTPYGHITYHKFSGEGQDDRGDVETTGGIFSIGAGAEMTLIPGPINPYLALEISANDFADVESKTSSGTTMDKGETRFGGAVGIGTEVTLLPVFTFDVSAKYNWFNLVGKKDGEQTMSAVTLNVMVLFSLL